jgi:symplekin
MEQIKRAMLLYLALCAKKHSLLHGLVATYATNSTRPLVRKVMHTQITELVRVIGMHSPHLLQLFVECPRGAEPLLLLILHTLTENVVPSPLLTQTIKRAYAEHRLDARFLIPIISGLTKVKNAELNPSSSSSSLPIIILTLSSSPLPLCASLPQKEMIEYLPALIQLPSNMVKTMIHRVLYTKPTPLTPAELLIALHLIPDEKLLKKTVEATQYCFEQGVVLKQEVLAVVLQQLLQVSPLPPLYMRTVIQAITKVKPMASFVLSNILAKLISKQIWNDKRLWEGFVKCIKVSLSVAAPLFPSLSIPSWFGLVWFDLI